MNTRVFAVVVAGLFLVSTIAVIPVRAQPVPIAGFNIIGATWGTLGNLTQVGAGSQDVQLVVTTQYYFSNTANGIVATLSLPPFFTDLNGGSNPSAFISGAVSSGMVVPFTFYLDVASYTPVGTYVIPITIQWGVSPAGAPSVSLIQNSVVTVQMNGKVKLFFQAEPSSLAPGEVNNVAVTLTNTGTGPASQISTTVSSSQISTTVSSSQLLSVLNGLPDLSSLGPNSSATATLRVYVPSTSAGSPVALSFTTTYTDAYGTTRSVSQSVGLFVALLPTTSPIEITASPTYLQAGLVNNITVTLTNDGASPIVGFSATFSFVGGQVTWLSPNLVQTQSLGPGENMTIQARVYDPPTTSGSSTLQVTMNYSYNNIASQAIRTLGLLSKGLIDLELTGSTILPQGVAPGQIVSITLTITNIGIIVASAVTAVVQMPQGFQSIGSGSSFVGDLQVDSPSTFTISALVSNSTKPGTYQVPVTLSYFDNLRTPLSKTVNVSVNVISGSAAGSSSSHSTSTAARRGGGLLTALTFVVVVVVIVAALLLYVRRRRSSRRPTE